MFIYHKLQLPQVKQDGSCYQLQKKSSNLLLECVFTSRVGVIYIWGYWSIKVLLIQWFEVAGLDVSHPHPGNNSSTWQVYLPALNLLTSNHLYTSVLGTGKKALWETVSCRRTWHSEPIWAWVQWTSHCQECNFFKSCNLNGSIKHTLWPPLTTDALGTVEFQLLKPNSYRSFVRSFVQLSGSSLWKIQA